MLQNGGKNNDQNSRDNQYIKVMGDKRHKRIFCALAIIVLLFGIFDQNFLNFFLAGVTTVQSQ